MKKTGADITVYHRSRLGNNSSDAVRASPHPTELWPRRFWEHMIRDERDFRQHVDYIHWNPVKHGWVKCVKDWPNSSFHRHVALGIYEENWGGYNGLSSFAAGQ